MDTVTNMVDTVFKSQTAPISQENLTKPMIDRKADRIASTVEVPYTDYEREHAHPYTVDHFQLGDSWKDPVGGFPKELSVIEEYFSNKINSGEIANTTEAVKSEIKKIERLTNTAKESRSIVKVETLAAYIEFLMKTDKLKLNLRRYANT